MTLTTSRPAAGERSPVRRGRRAGWLALLAVGGLGLLAVSHVVTARRQLVLAGADLRASRGALSKRDDGGATAILDRADRHLAAAASASSGFPLGVLRFVPFVGSPARASTTASRAGWEGVAAARALVAASSSFPTSASAAV